MPETLIIVPCYNEVRRLPVAEFVRFAEVAARAGIGFLFVNDGSTDDTARVLEELRTRRSEVFGVYNLARNGGKAEAVRLGMLEGFKSQPTYIGFWDADLATPLEVIPDFTALLRERAELDMVFGARVKLLGRQVVRRRLRHYPGRVFATAVSVALGMPIYDTQCGAKIFRHTELIRGLFAQRFLSRWIFDVEIIARYKIALRQSGAGKKAEDGMYELPLQKWCDMGHSKVKLKDYFRAAFDLGRIYWQTR